MCCDVSRISALDKPEPHWLSEALDAYGGSGATADRDTDENDLAPVDVVSVG